MICEDQDIWLGNLNIPGENQDIWLGNLNIPGVINPASMNMYDVQRDASVNTSVTRKMKKCKIQWNGILYVCKCKSDCCSTPSDQSLETRKLVITPLSQL